MQIEEKDNVFIGWCPNAACKNLHIEFVDHAVHGDFSLVMGPDDARLFATEILRVLDTRHGPH